MSQWVPVWSVQIDGVEYKNVTLANLSIQSGRTDIYTQAVAGYCNVQLINLDGSVILFNVNSSITIFVENSTSTPVAIFGGSVTDVIVGIASAGSNGYSQTVTITALGALSRLPKILTEGVLAKDLDGIQIASILEGALYGSWNEVPAALTWAAYNPTTTWSTAENSGVGEIDAGNYELTARTSEVIDAYSLISGLAISGLGYIYEDSQGRIGYADSTHRSIYLSTNGYVELSAGEALASGIETAIRGGDVRNAITITYKNDQVVNDLDPDSIAIYGSLAQNILTTLENGADATAQAAFYLALRAYPRANVNAITYQLGSPSVADDDRDDLIGVFMGMPVNIVDLPINMGSNYQGFVEGWVFEAGYNSLALTLYITPVAYSLDAFRWNNVPASERWNTVSPTLTWLDATVIA